MPATKNRISQLIKDRAKNLGFDACGIVKVGQLDRESSQFRKWLEQGFQADMGYMSRNIDKRLNPMLLNEWAKTLIIFTYNYYPSDHSLSEGKYKISRYAYGIDYHHVIKNKLKQIIDSIEDEVGEILARPFVDSAPIMEKAWAAKCGLGWIGKNTCLISKNKGSFHFLGSILTNLELSYDDEEVKDYCGNCSKCIDACPNGAIIAPGIVDARKCISYLTIEHKGSFDPESDSSLHGWIFGCDICQEVCPHNRFSKPHTEPDFLPSPRLKNMTETDWEELDKENFQKLFKGTALERTGFEGLRRNIENK